MDGMRSGLTAAHGTAAAPNANSERGAVAVEAALILPFLVLLFLGTVDVTLLFRDHVSATSLTRSGARVAASLPRFGTIDSTFGHSGTGDSSSFAQSAADAMQRAGSALPKNAIDYIWVYSADEDGEPTGVCPTIDSGGNVVNGNAPSCVLYRWVDANSRFTYRGGRWDPEGINSCLGDPDAQSVGVRLQATHTWLFSLFGAPATTVDARTVMKFEPRTVFDDENQPTSARPGFFAGCE